MVEPRDYQRFLRAASVANHPGERPVGMRALQSLLPAPPPAATLWSQGGLLVASALLPAILWWLGKLDPLGVILLYVAEGTAYALMVLARILFTAATPVAGERSRAGSAVGYALWCGVAWGVLVLFALACVAPKPAGVAWGEWLRDLVAHFAQPSMWMAAAATALVLALDVVRRSDYIDAYLDLGPRETARYGYVYPMALAFLLATALMLRVLWQGEALDAAHGLVPPAFFALWLVGWRTLMQLLNLTLPRWGRGLARLEGQVERALAPGPRDGVG